MRQSTTDSSRIKQLLAEALTDDITSREMFIPLPPPSLARLSRAKDSTINAHNKQALEIEDTEGLVLEEKK